MRRRDFITLLGGAAMAWPPAAHAQQSERVRRIGVLMGYAESDSEAQAQIAAFRDGLQKLGWTEGRNTRIDTRWATPDDADSMQRFAKELVALQPDLILSNTTPTTTELCNKRALFLSFSPWSPIRSAADLSRAFRDRAATSRVFRQLRTRWGASGWSCSRRLRRGSTGSRYCSIRQRRRSSKVI
jgi:putative ABC transport system substrate-binding protein